MPRGRKLGSSNKPKNPDTIKPRKPYTSTRRRTAPPREKEALLERLKKEVSDCAISIIPCDNIDSWLANYAQHEGNEYERCPRHEHTYNSTHHRVVTYGCNYQTEVRHPPAIGEEQSREASVELVQCEAILDIYFFYESNIYQIVRLGEHNHEPKNTPGMQALPGSIDPRQTEEDEEDLDETSEDGSTQL